MTSNRFIIVLSAKLCSTHILGAYFARELSAGWDFFREFSRQFLVVKCEIVHCWCIRILQIDSALSVWKFEALLSGSN